MIVPSVWCTKICNITHHPSHHDGAVHGADCPEWMIRVDYCDELVCVFAFFAIPTTSPTPFLMAHKDSSVHYCSPGAQEVGAVSLYESNATPWCTVSRTDI